MNERSLNLSELLQEALQTEYAVGPTNLIAVLSAAENPFQSERTALHEAHQADFGVIYRYRWSSIELDEADKAVWLDRLAWLLHTLAKTKDQPPELLVVLAMLHTASAFREYGSVWKEIPKDLHTDNLISRLAALVGSTKCMFSARGQHEPIWERESVDGFLKAESEGDWPALENAWRTIVSAIPPDGDMAEAINCLNITDRGQQSLSTALDKAGSVLVSAQAANAMTSEQIAAVASYATTNQTRFALIQSLVFNHPRNAPMSSDALENVTSVLKAVQTDEGEWDKWMRALNRYPVRIASIQTALGASLVNSTKSAKSVYVNAIELKTSHGECREAVSTCLTVFRSKASFTERTVMWQHCYKRWIAWDFGRDYKTTSLVWMAVSDLDYGVIGYFVECLLETDLQKELSAFSTSLSECQNEWHADRISYDAAWYRALSRWQIANYANLVRSGEQPWEWPQRMYLPFDAKTDHYASMSLGTQIPYGLSDS